MWPLLGLFKFDLYGFTAYWYALIVLFLFFLVSAAADQLAVRAVAARHPRERGAHAGDRRGKPAAHPQDLHHLRGHGRRRRRGADADHRDGVARRARLPALGRHPGDPHSRRHRAALWRADRRHHLHDRARLVLRRQSAILVFPDRRAADRGRAVPAERHPGRHRPAHQHRARPALVRLGHLAATVGADDRERRSSPRAASTRASARSWSPRTSRSRCRAACATR